MSGYASFLYKSDQEPAILDFKKAVAARLRQVAGDETMKIELMESPVGQSQANSLVERAIWDVEGLTRTLVCAAEAFHGVTLEPTHPVRLWAIEYAAQLYNRFAKSSEDGRTPYELRRGKPFRRRLPLFVEPVLYMKVAKGKRRQKHEDRFETALYLGLIDRSNEVRLGNADGVFKALSLIHI